MDKLINIKITDRDLKRLFKDNPNLKNKDNTLYFNIKVKGGYKE